MHIYIYILEESGPVGPLLLVGGPSGLLDFVLRALRPLRPCDPRNDALDSEQTLVLVLLLVFVILLLVFVILLLVFVVVILLLLLLVVVVPRPVRRLGKISK